MKLKVNGATNLSLRGTCLCRKCGARFKPEQFIKTESDRIWKCPNGDCHYPLIDLTGDSFDTEHFLCDEIEID